MRKCGGCAKRRAKLRALVIKALKSRETATAEKPAK